VPKHRLHVIIRKRGVFMRILGIDPGFAIMGYGVIDYYKNKVEVLEYGVIRTEAHTDFNKRLLKNYQGINEIISLYNPEHISMEQLFYNTNQKTVINVCQARGVAVLAVAQKDLPFFEYTPLQIKQALCGYGRADKNQVQQMVKVLANLKDIPKPDDAADALAVAICHAHSYREERNNKNTCTSI